MLIIIYSLLFLLRHFLKIIDVCGISYKLEAILWQWQTEICMVTFYCICAVHLNLPVDLGDEKCRHMISYTVCAEYEEWLKVFSVQSYEIIADCKLQ
jgi:hypothetical protein